MLREKAKLNHIKHSIKITEHKKKETKNKRNEKKMVIKMVDINQKISIHFKYEWSKYIK